MREHFHWGPTSRASYIALEHGRREDKLTDADKAYLAAFYGKTVDQVESVYVAGEPPTDVLVAALERQSLAIEALVAELRLGRASHETEVVTILQGLGSLGATLTPRGTPDGSVLGAPAGTDR